MRIYSLQAPDGNIYDLQAPEGASEQELTATLYSLKPEAAQPFVKESGVIAQGKKGIEQLVSGFQTTGEVALGDKNEAARNALARQAEFDRKYEQSPSLDRTAEAFKQKGFFSGLGQLASDAPEVLSANLPQIGASYAGGKAGVAAGSKLGSAFGPRGRAVGAFLGGAAGTLGVNYPSQLSGNVETQAEEQVSKGKPIDINVNKIVKSYICLNGAKRSHRVMFLCYLREHQLLDCGILSWHFDSAPASLPSTTKVISNTTNLPTALVFVTTTPFTNINDRFEIDVAGQDVFNRHYWFFSNNWKDTAITGGPNTNRWDIPSVQQAFLYVSVETVLQYPYPYLTEKTFRAILYKRPFVILGAPGSLAQIKKLGFKTFDHLWNEDYDLIQDPNHRIQAVIKIVKEIGALSIDQLKDLMYGVQDTVEFNHKFYVQEFSNTILNHRLDTI
jgi:hypothetical protein